MRCCLIQDGRGLIGPQIRTIKLWMYTCSDHCGKEERLHCQLMQDVRGQMRNLNCLALLVMGSRMAILTRVFLNYCFSLFIFSQNSSEIAFRGPRKCDVMENGVKTIYGL